VKRNSEVAHHRIDRGVVAAVLVLAAAVGWVLLGWTLFASPPRVESAREERRAPVAATTAPAEPVPVATPAPTPAPAPEVSPAPAPSAVDPMERLRAIVDSNPVAALALAREEARRAPDGPFADERSYRATQALVHLHQIAAARDEAAALFRSHPESPWCERMERLTGVHPRRYYQNAR
jgi:hypothetical protein